MRTTTIAGARRMNEREPSIRIPVDPTNPGQFFACCGLLELAHRRWPGAEGWFDRREFGILTIDQAKTLSELLSEARSTSFEVGDDAEGDDGDSKDEDLPVEPIRMQWNNGRPAIHLDWWADKSIKPWAGSMKERVILRAMLDAIDPLTRDPFDDLKVVLYKSPTKKNAAKKEPFYFDPRRGNKSHPLDSGFSPDTHKAHAECCPALEALCFIGLQRARPASTGIANHSRYTVWTHPVSASLVGAVACGVVPIPGSINYLFNNYFRTDQRKHKTFSQATLERSKTNV
jgi:CRISPR-associated protein Csb3